MRLVTQVDDDDDAYRLIYTLLYIRTAENVQLRNDTIKRCTKTRRKGGDLISLSVTFSSELAEAEEGGHRQKKNR